ncbi:MAG: TonB-dependent receptor [Balneolaceae bacterium]
MTFKLPGFSSPITLILAITTLFVVIANRPLFAQNSSSINGYISDRTTGETLIAANVALLEINRGAASNTSGYYSITNLPPGTYTIAASYIGYRLFEEAVELEAGETLRLDIELIPEGVELEEIVVQSESELEELQNIGVSQVETALIRSLPAIFEPDVFRSVQLLPGVKAASDFSSGLYIRGGSPDQTLILLDETTVYNPSHFFGFYSTFNPDAVKDVRLYKGGYPAQYGGRLGSVLTVYNKDGNRNEFRGTVSAGMLASRAMIEGPYRYGSWMIAVRRSTLEPLLAALRTQAELVPETFYFTDINGKLNIDASENNRFSVAFYSGNDRVQIPLNQDAEISLMYGNQTLSTTWRHIFSDRLFGSATVTGSRYFNQPEFEFAQTAFERDNDIYDWSAKSDLEFIQSERSTWSAGIWSGFLTLRFRDSFDNQESFHSRIHTRYTSAYLQNRWRPHPDWILTAGLRGNYFSEGEFSRLEPRISLDYQPNPSIRLQAAYGRYYQYLTLITNEAFSGFDLWLTTAEGVPPSYGDQFVIGAKTVPFEKYGLDIELYYRTMQDLFELNPFINNPAGLDYRELFRFGEGYAYGLELFFERTEGTLTGFLGYTFGVTRRKFPGFNQDILDEPNRGRFYPPKYDRTHDLNLVIQYRLSDRWAFTSVFNYATGQAYTEPAGRTQMDRTPWDNLIRDVFIIENLNAARLPSYHRLDIGVSRSGSFFQIADGEWQFQLINAYSRKNIWFYQYDFEENPVEKNDVPLLPILPAISYTVTF